MRMDAILVGKHRRKQNSCEMGCTNITIYLGGFKLYLWTRCVCGKTRLHSGNSQSLQIIEVNNAGKEKRDGALEQIRVSDFASKGRIRLHQ